MKVISKQKNSRMCYICGMDNPNGLKAQFYNMEDNSVMTKFMYNEYHQSFPQRVHGGLIATMLDELAFRSYWIIDENALGTTMSFEVKFRKPVPYDIPLLGKGKVIKNMSKFFESEVSILDLDNNILSNAIVKYIKLPIEKIADANFHDEMCYLIKDDIIEL